MLESQRIGTIDKERADDNIKIIVSFYFEKKVCF